MLERQEAKNQSTTFVLDMKDGVVQNLFSDKEEPVDFIVRSRNGNSKPEEVYQFTPKFDTSMVDQAVSNLMKMFVIFVPTSRQYWPYSTEVKAVKFKRNGVNLDIFTMYEYGEGEFDEFQPGQDIKPGFAGCVLTSQYKDGAWYIWVLNPCDVGQEHHFSGTLELKNKQYFEMDLVHPKIMALDKTEDTSQDTSNQRIHHKWNPRGKLSLSRLQQISKNNGPLPIGVLAREDRVRRETIVEWAHYIIRTDNPGLKLCNRQGKVFCPGVSLPRGAVNKGLYLKLSNKDFFTWLCDSPV